MQDRYSFEKGAHRERYSEYRDQPRLHPRGTRAVYERPVQSQGPILARKPRYPTEEPRPGALLRVCCSSLVIKPQVKSLRISKEPKGSELFRGISRNLCQNRPSRDYFFRRLHFPRKPRLRMQAELASNSYRAPETTIVTGKPPPRIPGHTKRHVIHRDSRDVRPIRLQRCRAFRIVHAL